jgi:hypothetical protein
LSGPAFFWGDETDEAQLPMYQPNPDFREPQATGHASPVGAGMFQARAETCSAYPPCWRRDGICGRDNQTPIAA